MVDMVTMAHLRTACLKLLVDQDAAEDWNPDNNLNGSSDFLCRLTTPWADLVADMKVASGPLSSFLSR